MCLEEAFAQQVVIDPGNIRRPVSIPGGGLSGAGDSFTGRTPRDSYPAIYFHCRVVTSPPSGAAFRGLPVPSCCLTSPSRPTRPYLCSWRIRLSW